jgi:phosphoglycolate phosphatase
MARKFDLLVFDWDGTLCDSVAAIVEAVQAACRDLGIEEPSDYHARQVIGLGLADALRHSAPNLDEDRFPEMVERYRFHYLSQDHRLRLFDGVPELLHEMTSAGFTLAIATGKSRLGLNRALANPGLAAFFSATRCADECFSKPHPQMLQELMEEFDVPPERTLMIGDTTHDLLMAKNAGAASLAVSYGAHAAEVLETLAPLACLSAVSEVRCWLKSNA